MLRVEARFSLQDKILLLVLFLFYFPIYVSILFFTLFHFVNSRNVVRRSVVFCLCNVSLFFLR